MIKRIQYIALIILTSLSNAYGGGFSSDNLKLTKTDDNVLSIKHEFSNDDSEKRRKKVTICSCTELSLKGLREVGMDEEKMKAFESKNKEELLLCEELGEKISEEMELMTTAEQDDKRKEYTADCPAIEELETLVLKLMQEAYEDFEKESDTTLKSDSLQKLKNESKKTIEIDYDTASKICTCEMLKTKISNRLDKTAIEVLEAEFNEMYCSELLEKYNAHMSTLAGSEQQIKRREMANFCENLQRTKDLLESREFDNEEQARKSKNAVEIALSSVPEKITLCSCTELSLKGFKEVGLDDDKMKAFEEKHALELQKCEELGDAIMVEFESISDEEQEARRKMYMEDCPAMRELEKLIMEQYEKKSSGQIEDVKEAEGIEVIEED